MELTILQKMQIVLMVSEKIDTQNYDKVMFTELRCKQLHNLFIKDLSLNRELHNLNGLTNPILK